jgi:hypothetical protein
MSMGIKSIEAQAVDGMVVNRIYTVDDELLLEYQLTPTDAMNVARNQMEKAAEAVAQPAPEPKQYGRHAKAED